MLAVYRRRSRILYMTPLEPEYSVFELDHLTTSTHSMLAALAVRRHAFRGVLLLGQFVQVPGICLALQHGCRCACMSGLCSHAPEECESKR